MGSRLVGSVVASIASRVKIAEVRRWFTAGMLYRAAILASEVWRCEIERYSWRLYSNVMKAERERQ